MGSNAAALRKDPFTALVASGLLALALFSRESVAAELSTHATERFSGAGNCAFCHDQWGQALTDAKGRSVSITEDWRGTMMAHSFRDPFWRATMEAEVAEHPKLKAVIETKCLTCHGAMARAEAKERGTELLTVRQAQKNLLAGEGVGCTLCHQILADNLGHADSFTGGFKLGKERVIFGPYDEVVTMPMQHHVDYTPTFGRHVQDSSLCGTCHTLFTPVLSDEGRVVGEFAEQTPFLEWRHSDYSRAGKQCQDCHMPLVREPVKISARPPWLGKREPFWRHQFVGGNAFMLRMLSDNTDGLNANAEPAQFAPLIQEAVSQLRRAVRISAEGRRQGGAGILEVELENLTGHKFPSGHPYRRAWLHVRITDAQGHTVFESGSVDSDGRIRGLEAEYGEHHQTITDPNKVQVYQSVMGDASGKPTWSLLQAASLLKDNRLPPKGFRPEGEDLRHIKVCGEAAADPDYQEGTGKDRVTYRFPIAAGGGNYKAEVRLFYQAVPPETVARLLASKSPEAKRFSALYRKVEKTPEVVGRWEGDLKDI